MTTAFHRAWRHTITGIGQTIEEYEQSAALLRGRVAQLNLRLSRERELRKSDNRKALETRRYYLYSELAQLEQAIADMQDYLRCSQCRQRQHPPD